MPGLRQTLILSQLTADCKPDLSSTFPVRLSDQNGVGMNDTSTNVGSENGLILVIRCENSELCW